MTSDFFEIFLLSIIQGVSEFIPVSSAAHLILASNIYEFKNVKICENWSAKPTQKGGLIQKGRF